MASSPPMLLDERRSCKLDSGFDHVTWNTKDVVVVLRDLHTFKSNE